GRVLMRSEGRVLLRRGGLVLLPGDGHVVLRRGHRVWGRGGHAFRCGQGRFVRALYRFCHAAASVRATHSETPPASVRKNAVESSRPAATSNTCRNAPAFCFDAAAAIASFRHLAHNRRRSCSATHSRQ